MSPVYELEWRMAVPDEEDRVIRTRANGSTGQKAIQNALNSPGGLMASEIEGYGAPAVRLLGEDDI